MAVIRCMLGIIAALAWISPAAAAGDIAVAPLPSPARGTVTISVTVTGILKPGEVRINLDGARLQTCPRSPCAVQWNTTTAADGAHEIKVKAFNSVGVLKASRAIPVTVDNRPPVSDAAPRIAGCRVFPPDNAWNTDVSRYPVHPNSSNYIASIGTGKLHPDFGDVYGIPFTTVPGTQPKVPISFYWDDESDPGPYPIPPDAPVEGGSDRHVLVLDRDRCVLYEMYNAEREGAGWSADSGAVWDFNVNATRPARWTSADAAGLPILPGLVRYDEVVEKGEMNHAVRFTVSRTQMAYVAPASHWASGDANPNLPPMGLRLRLKASFDISRFHPQVQVILRALKTYGMIVADNGSSWFITGALDPRWDNEILDGLKTIAGTNFEVVDTGPIVTPKR
jgi:hypothetical protein